MMEYFPFGGYLLLCDPGGAIGRVVAVKDVAIAAIMAGCKPNAMPGLVAA